VTTTLEITFPFGRYHGTPWGRHVNEGAVDWPPAPWRLMRAFVAVWRQRATELDEQDVGRLLQALAVPPRYAVPRSAGGHTRHYMPASDHLAGVKPSVDKVLDTFAAFPPGSGLLVQWDVDLDDRARRALEVLAARLGYLGRSESVCSARVLPRSPEAAWLEPLLEQPASASVSHDRLVRLLAPALPLDLDALTRGTLELRQDRRLVPRGARWIWYPSGFRSGTGRSGAEEEPRVDHQLTVARPVAVRWAYWSPAAPPLTEAVRIAESLHRAAVSRFTVRPRRGDGRHLTGLDAHGRPLVGHGHAHWLAFSSTGDQSQRRIDSLAAYAPEGFEPDEVLSLCSLVELRSYLQGRVVRARLALEAVGQADHVLPELVGPARTWRSHTPYAAPRHPRPNQSFQEHVERYVRRDLAQAGHPPPLAVRPFSAAGSWLDFHRRRRTDRLAEARPAQGIELEFPVEVAGPLVLGALRHFGLGLFRPVG
jgi:CRISPR-associated protein Csb2